MKTSTRFRFILYGLLLFLLIACPLTAPSSLSALLSADSQDPPYSQDPAETADERDVSESASGPVSTAAPSWTPTAAAVTETPEQSPVPTPALPPAAAAEVSQETLIEVWQPPLDVFTLLSGICEGTLKTAQNSASDSGAGLGDGEKLAIDIFINAVERELNRWQPNADTEPHFSSAWKHLDRLNQEVDRWEQGELNAAEAAEQISESCGAVQDELEHVIRDALMDGVTPDSLELIATELQERLSNQNTLDSSQEDIQAENGLSRQNPFPPRSLHHTPRWGIEVLDTMRGEEAWQRLRAASSYNSPPREGMEYVLVKIRAIRSEEADEERSISPWDFKLTGDRLREYPAAVVVEPEPALNTDLSPGEQAEGWVTFEVAEDEGKLILILDEIATLGRNRFRFFALSEGASIRPAANLKSIQPSRAGLQRSQPVPVGKSAVTEDWEVRVEEVVRGEEAQQILAAEDVTASPPEDVEWVLVKVFVRYLGDTDAPATMDRFSFNSSGEGGVLYDAPPVAAPHPALDISLFPGGEYEGWLVLQAAPGEQDPVAVFRPWNDLDNTNRRYLSLTP